jgi:1,4-alpha-glucan branching enzyme
VTTSNITFKVNMNDYTGAFTAVTLNGTFNNWCGSCNPMTDANADGIWEVTLPITGSSIEYKYTLDGLSLIHI